MESKRQRKENFSHGECQILIDEVERAHSVLFNKFSNTLDWATKTRKWSEITEKINACDGESVRTTTQDEVKKKWQDLKKGAKAKECAKRHYVKGTGGGPPPRELSPMEEKIISIIPEVLIEGIPGGLDTEPMCLEEEVVQVDVVGLEPRLPQKQNEMGEEHQEATTSKLKHVIRKESKSNEDLLLEIEQES